MTISEPESVKTVSNSPPPNSNANKSIKSEDPVPAFVTSDSIKGAEVETRFFPNPDISKTPPPPNPQRYSKRIKKEPNASGLTTKKWTVSLVLKTGIKQVKNWPFSTI